MATRAPVPARPAGAGALAQLEARRRARVRRFVTPEGVDLELEIASAGQRFAALLIDVALMATILVVMTISFGFAGFDWADGGAMLIIWMLGAFLLRNFWFIGFELGARAATPGKRLLGIRVVARDGGRLTVAAVVARNLVREMELFLPVAFMAGAASAGDPLEGFTIMLGLIWSLVLGLFLLFNRDRMRLGDLIGGTWVVLARRRRIAADIAASSAARADDGPQFSQAELGVYGVYELQELERILRHGNDKTRRVVADTIRAKLDRPVIEDDMVFLLAYYRQAKARMERDLLFGKRRANKYEESA